MEGFSKKSFDTYLELVSDFDGKNPLIKDASSLEKQAHIFSDEDIDIFIDRLSEVDENIEKSEYLKTMTSFPVVKKHLFFPVESRSYLLEKISSHLKTNRDKIAASDCSPYALRRLANRHSPSAHPFHKVTLELYDYLFRDRQKEINEKKLLKEKIDSYLRICDEISETLSKNSALSAEFSMSPKHFTEGRSPAKFIRMNLDSVKIENTYPKMNEKIFVQNMIKINQRFYRKPKLNMIQELMCLPFFKHQYDPTTLSRIKKNMQ